MLLSTGQQARWYIDATLIGDGICIGCALGTGDSTGSTGSGVFFSSTATGCGAGAEGAAGSVAGSAGAALDFDFDFGLGAAAAAAAAAFSCSAFSLSAWAFALAACSASSFCFWASSARCYSRRALSIAFAWSRATDLNSFCSYLRWRLRASLVLGVSDILGVGLCLECRALSLLNKVLNPLLGHI